MLAFSLGWLGVSTATEDQVAQISGGGFQNNEYSKTLYEEEDYKEYVEGTAIVTIPGLGVTTNTFSHFADHDGSFGGRFPGFKRWGADGLDPSASATNHFGVYHLLPFNVTSGTCSTTFIFKGRTSVMDRVVSFEEKHLTFSIGVTQRWEFQEGIKLEIIARNKSPREATIPLPPIPILGSSRQIVLKKFKDWAPTENTNNDLPSPRLAFRDEFRRFTNATYTANLVFSKKTCVKATIFKNDETKFAEGEKKFWLDRILGQDWKIANPVPDSSDTAISLRGDRKAVISQAPVEDELRKLAEAFGATVTLPIYEKGYSILGYSTVYWNAIRDSLSPDGPDTIQLDGIPDRSKKRY
jgi:hypothetical protein